MTSNSDRKALLTAAIPAPRTPKATSQRNGPPKEPRTKAAKATTPGGGGGGDKFEAAIRELTGKVDDRLATESDEGKKTALEGAKVALEFALWTVDQGNLAPKHAGDLRNSGYEGYAAAKQLFDGLDDAPPPAVIEPAVRSEFLVG